MSLRRIWGVMLRYFFQFNRSLDRWLDAFYFPLWDVFIWGLILSSFSLVAKDIQSQAILIFSGLTLWYAIYRGQYEISMNILEDFWSENLVNFFSSPIRISEWITAMLLLGFSKTLLNLFFVIFLAWIFFATNVFSLGFVMIPFIINLLIVGWSCGLLVGGLFLRFGTKMQSIGWAGVFILMPLSGVFYPISMLPIWVQKIAYLLPSSYVFEGMRSVLLQHVVPNGMIIKAFLWNIFYFVLGVWFFYRSFKRAQEKGIAHLK
jgi:ABC-2 type transport system permease protein